ncbi:hypothetical protein [Lacinutrix salivirga]
MKNILCLISIIFFFACKQNNPDLYTEEIIKIEKGDSLNISQISQVKYPILYTQIKADSIKKDFKIDSINVNQSAWINNIQFITGTIDGNKNGIHLIVKNSLNKILYKSKGQQDSWRYNPYFFKSKKSNRMIVVSEIGDEESWGIHIQDYNNENYKELGSLNIVASNEFEESINIVPFIKIQELSSDLLQFYFDESTKIYDNELEEIYSGVNLKYNYSKNKIIKVN